MEELIKIQNELKAPKDLHNKFGNYNYRSAESILEALKPLLQKYGCLLTVSDDMVEIGNRVYVQATASIEAGGKIKSCTAYAREEETKKGMDASQITGSASSYARKYALNGLFLIDDTKDADATNDHKPEVASYKEPKQTKLIDLKEGDANWTKVVNYLTEKGGSMAELGQKYNISSETQQKLIQTVIDFKK